MGDDPPEIELVVEETGITTEAAVQDGRWSPRAILVVVAVLGALVAAAVFTSGGDEEADGDSTSTSTATTGQPGAAWTAVGGPEPVASDGYLTGEPEPVFGGPVGASVLLAGAEGSWKVLDLDTGAVERLRWSGPDTIPPAVVPVVGGVVIHTGGFDSLRFLPLTSDGTLADEPERLVVDLRAVGVDVGGTFVRLSRLDRMVHREATDSTFWLVFAPQSDFDDRHAIRVATDGEVVVGPLPLSAEPRATTDRGVVFDAGGRSYLASERGTDDLGPGRSFAARGSLVGRIVCEVDAVCRPEVLDVGSGERWAGDPVRLDEVSNDAVDMSFSADGALVTTLGRHHISIMYPGGVAGPSTQSSLGGPPAWLPGGPELVAPAGNAIGHFSVHDDLGTMVKDGRAGGFGPDETGELYVIPHA